MQDKAEFAKLLAELGLPFPQTDFVRTRDALLRDWQFPCYIKVAHSTAGRGVHHVTSANELREVADKLTAAGILDGKTDTLVQQPAKGVLSTAQAVFQRGRMVGAHVFESRELGVGGMSTARVSAVHPVVVEHAAKLGAHLHWHGAVFLDYFFDHETGRPEYIEANPRIGETVNAMLTGVNLGELLLRVSRGEPLDQQPPQITSRPGVRTQSFFMILLSRALVGAGRRQLLAEIWRRRRGRGLYADSQDDLTRASEDPWSVLPPLWIALQLLVWPGLSHRIVAKAIRDYSLPAATAQTIQELPEGMFTQCLTAARARHAGSKSRA
jgi:predicted ATP-grasp superfamily ATP-dependent carboligase